MGMASNEGRIEVIPLLLEAGADVDMPSKVGPTRIDSYPGS